MSRLVKVTVEIEQPTADTYYHTNRVPSGPSKIAVEEYTGDSDLAVAKFIVRVAELIHAEAAKRDAPAPQQSVTVAWPVPTKAKRNRRSV